MVHKFLKKNQEFLAPNDVKIALKIIAGIPFCIQVYTPYSCQYFLTALFFINVCQYLIYQFYILALLTVKKSEFAAISIQYLLGLECWIRGQNRKDFRASPELVLLFFLSFQVLKASCKS